MTKRNRKTLADNFSEGMMPSQEAFEDLIDSMVNIVDDGFDKSPSDGMKVAQLGNDGKLISFYDDIAVRNPLWSIALSMPDYGTNPDSVQNLGFYYADARIPGVTLAGSGVSSELEEAGREGTIKVGINQNAPAHELDVGGVIASDGRIGREGRSEMRVPADGKWHPIIQGLDGCHAFEIMAGVGKKRSGRYALLHAFALSTFNSSKGNITAHQAHFSSRCDQIDLRWVGAQHNYALEMRTRCDFGPNGAEAVYIRYYITRLWFDPFMDNCAEGDGTDSSEAAK